MNRAEAIGSLRGLKMLLGFHADEALDMAIAALREQKPKWISVEERLPEVDVTVLTLDRWGHIHDRYMYRHKDGTPVFTAEYLVSTRDVTHWMPLPEMPEV